MNNLKSDLFKKFEDSKIEKSASIIGGRTRRRNDCNTSCGDGDCDTKWRHDSTVRGDDGCNETINVVGGTASVSNS